MNTNVKVIFIVFIAIGAYLLSIVSQEIFQNRERNNLQALSHIDLVMVLIKNIPPLKRNFIQDADMKSWEQISQTMTSLKTNLHEIFPLASNWQQQMEELNQRLDEYDTLLIQIQDPVINLNIKKGEIQAIGLSFSMEVEQKIINPIKDDESLQLYLGKPIDPFKTRFKDEAYDLLSLHLKQQILLLEFVLSTDMATYKEGKEAISSALERNESQLEYMAVLIGSKPEFQSVLDSLHNKIKILLDYEHDIIEYFKIFSDIDHRLNVVGDDLKAVSTELAIQINNDIVNLDRLNQIFNWGFLFCILCVFSILGYFLGRDIIRFVKNINIAQEGLKESEERFRTLIKQAADAMFLTDSDGSIIEVNNRACESLGYTRAEMLTLRLNDFEDVTIEEVHKKAIRDRLVPGNPVTIEGKHLRKDGTVFPVEIRVGLIVYSGKNAFLEIVRDITARKQIEDALQLSEENLRITLDSIGDGVIATDINGRVTRMNRVAEQLTGWKRENAWGLELKKIFHIIDSETRKEIDDPVAKVSREKMKFELSGSTILLSADGKEYLITENSAPIENERGENFGIVLIFRDVTEKYHMQERLRQSQKMDAIGQLAGGVAHDFNNMLTGIMVSADLISEQLRSNKAVNEYINIILDTSARAADLTQKLLAFSRKGTVLTTSFDIHESIGNVISILSRSIDKNIEISLDLKAKKTIIHGDSTLLQSVIMNLAINARDAMSLGGRLLIKTKNIELDGDYCKKSTFNINPGEYIEIMISDTGVGMDKKTMDRIFEPFFTTKSEGKGTGLGLAATYGIVNEHKGEIYVQSTRNKGTVFTIVLPIAVDSTSETEKKERKQIESGEGCILIVDDEYIIRAATSKLLEKTGYEVLTAEDGMKAIEIYKKNMNSIDIILLDLIMPHKSGKDTYYELKAINSNVKIIISSGYTPDITTEDLLKTGASGFIKKPYKWEELAFIVKKVLQPN